jgi:hypothetical protein
MKRISHIIYNNGTPLNKEIMIPKIIANNYNSKL